MKQFLIFALLLLSPDVKPQLSNIQIDSLYRLCKFWGTAKYFNTSMSSKIPDADDYLLSRLDSILNTSAYKFNLTRDLQNHLSTPTSTDASSFHCLTGWQVLPIHKLSNYAILSKNHSAVLEADNKYSTIEFPDANHRLLSLFRLWNAIEFFGPVKKYAADNWDTLLKKQIPIFYTIGNKIDYNLRLMEFLSLLRDGHAIPFSAERNNFFGKYNLPFEMVFVDRQAVVSEITNKRKCKKLKVSPGMEVVSLQGESILARTNKNLKYISVTNTAYRQDICLNVGMNSRKTEIAFIRNGKTENYQLRLDAPLKHALLLIRREKSRVTSKLIADSILYIDLTALEVKKVARLTKSLKLVSNLIFDLRGYPKSEALDTILHILFDQAKPIAKLVTPSPDRPGCLDTLTEWFTPSKQNFEYSGTIFVLVNERTISAGEFSCMMIQAFAKKSVVVGMHTAGCDGNVSRVLLPGNVNVMFTGMEVLYPDGTITQNRGIKVDHLVSRTIDGISKGEDEQLQHILTLINSGGEMRTNNQ